jgi:hypothetical protein
MPLLADSWESLIAFVVILLLSGLTNWLRQRKGLPPVEAEEDTERPVPPRVLRRRPVAPEETPTPQREFDFERDLRRLFGEEEVRPPAPPPLVVVAPQEAPAPPPPPRPVFESLEAEPAPARELATLAEAEQAYQRASAIDAEAQARLEAARTRAEAAKALAAARSAAAAHRAAGRSPEVDAVLASLRSPRTARQAVLASIVLGPPRALDEPFPAIPGLRW